jgi:hypothetical protein
MAAVTATTVEATSDSRLMDAIAELKLDAIAELALERHRLHDASEDLMAAIDELVHLTGGDWEAAIDELVNVSFDVTQESPLREETSSERLAAAREHLSRAGREWAATVAVIATLEEETLEEESLDRIDRRRLDKERLDRIDRRRLDAALERIEHQSSPTFRDRLAAAFAQVAR